MEEIRDLSVDEKIRMISPIFSEVAASKQNTINIIPDWFCKMPDHSGLKAGHVADHFTDSRVIWASSILNGFAGKTILELGPFEGYNSYQFNNFGAASVLSIESSLINFLKCLIVKNAFNLNTTFLYGDFVKYMEMSSARFDLCWASGVLYHMTDPVRLLTSIAKMSNAVFIWTQYHEDQLDSNVEFDPSLNVNTNFQGREIVLHYRRYIKTEGSSYSGGAATFSYWMSKMDIMDVLKSLGFVEIVMGVDNPKHPTGPACFFLALRP